MASFSNYLESKVLNYLFNGAAFSIGTLYVGLYTAAPTDAGGGTEVSGNGYARVAVTCNTTNFPTTNDGVIENGVTFNFPTPTGNWGTVTHIGLFDAATAGNLLAWAPLVTIRTITTGATVRINQNQLTIGLE